uniref:VP1 n=1 Tax=Phylloscopus schwarzi parvoviridae sp. TaxID=2794533 RepID=A0A8A4XE71_9VIRU|nr:MAG: VP1 [Phylloscopus schwarzi parvoviridae sp.]
MGKWDFSALSRIWNAAKRVKVKVTNTKNKIHDWLKTRPEYNSAMEIKDIYKAIKDRRFKQKIQMSQSMDKFLSKKRHNPKFMVEWREDFAIDREWIEDYYNLSVHDFLPRYGMNNYITQSEFFKKNRHLKINEYIKALEEEEKKDNNFILYEAFKDKKEVPYSRYTGKHFLPSEKKDLTLPGHNYIGPGNNLEGHPVVNEVDLIAKNHDYAYSEAKTQEDITRSDIIAVEKFKETNTLAGDLGAQILGAKAFTEQAFGNMYGLKPEFDYEKMYEGNIHTQIKQIKLLMESEEQDYIDYENMYNSYLREQEEKHLIDKESANTLWDEELQNKAQYDENELVYRCTRTGLKCVQMFGKGKKGTTLNKPQWEYAVSQAAHNKFRHLLNRPGNSDNREYYNAVQKYIIYRHKELQKEIGKEAYDKEFLPERKYVNLNNLTEKSIGAYSRSEEDQKLLKDQLDFINNNADEIFAAHEDPDLLEIGSKRPGQSHPDEPASKVLAEDTDSEEEDEIPDSQIPSENIPDSQEMASQEVPAVPMDTQESGIAATQSAPRAASTIGSGGGSGSTSVATHSIMQNRGGASPSLFHWENEFILQTWGNATFQNRQPGTNKNYEMTYSLAGLPTNMLSFYLPYTAYTEMINQGFGDCKILEVGWKVEPIGPTVAFNTNEQTTSVAAPSHILYGYHSDNINGKFPYDFVTITREQNSMVLSGVARADSAAIWASRLWGYTRDTGGNDVTEEVRSAANFGKVYAPHYLRIHHPPLFELTNTFTGTTVANSTNQVRQNMIVGRYPLSSVIPTYTMKQFETQKSVLIQGSHKPRNPINFSNNQISYMNLIHETAQGFIRAIAPFGVGRQNFDNTSVEQENGGVVTAPGHYTQLADALAMYVQGWKSIFRATQDIPTDDGQRLNQPFREYINSTIEGLYINRGFDSAKSGEVITPAQPVFGIHPVNGNTPQQASLPINVSYDYKISTYIKAIRTFSRNGFNAVPYQFTKNAVGLVQSLNTLEGVLDYGHTQLTKDPLWLIQNTYAPPTGESTSWAWNFVNRPNRRNAGRMMMNGDIPTQPKIILPRVTRSMARKSNEITEIESIDQEQEFGPSRVWRKTIQKPNEKPNEKSNVKKVKIN